MIALGGRNPSIDSYALSWVDDNFFCARNGYIKSSGRRSSWRPRV